MFYSLFVLFTNLKYPSLLGTWWISIYIQNILMPDVFTVNLEQISQTGLLFPLLTLNKYMPASLLYQELVIQSGAFEMTWNHTRNKKKNNTLLEVISNPRIYVSRRLYYNKLKTYRAAVFSYRTQSKNHSRQNVLEIWTTNENFKNLENKILWNTYWKDQLKCRKVQACGSPKKKKKKQEPKKGQAP